MQSLTMQSLLNCRHCCAVRAHLYVGFSTDSILQRWEC